MNEDVENDKDSTYCVQTGIHNDTASYCGRDLSMEWRYTDPTHAILDMKNKGCRSICQKCKVEMIKFLEDRE